MGKKTEITEQMIDNEIARQQYIEQGGYAPAPPIIPTVKVSYSVGQIAAGVLLGNLATGLIGTLVWFLIMAITS